MARIQRISVRTDALGEGLKSYSGKRLIIAMGKGKKASVTDIVQVTKGSLTYHLAPAAAWGSVYSANDHGGWRVVGEPHQSRRSAGAARRKGNGMTPWEKSAIDTAVYTVLESWGKRGVTPTVLTEDLFRNWGMGLEGHFLDNAAEGRELSPQARKVQYLKSAQQSAVTASLGRLVKSKKAAKFEGTGSRGGRTVATNYIAAKFW